MLGFNRHQLEREQAAHLSRLAHVSSQIDTTIPYSYKQKLSTLASSTPTASTSPDPAFSRVKALSNLAREWEIDNSNKHLVERLLHTKSCYSSLNEKALREQEKKKAKEYTRTNSRHKAAKVRAAHVEQENEILLAALKRIESHAGAYNKQKFESSHDKYREIMRAREEMTQAHRRREQEEQMIRMGLAPSRAKQMRMEEKEREEERRKKAASATTLPTIQGAEGKGDVGRGMQRKSNLLNSTGNLRKRPSSTGNGSGVSLSATSSLASLTKTRPTTGNSNESNNTKSSPLHVLAFPVASSSSSSSSSSFESAATSSSQPTSLSARTLASLNPSSSNPSSNSNDSNSTVNQGSPFIQATVNVVIDSPPLDLSIEETAAEVPSTHLPATTVNEEEEKHQDLQYDNSAIQDHHSRHSSSSSKSINHHSSQTDSHTLGTPSPHPLHSSSPHTSDPSSRRESISSIPSSFPSESNTPRIEENEVPQDAENGKGIDGKEGGGEEEKYENMFPSSHSRSSSSSLSSLAPLYLTTRISGHNVHLKAVERSPSGPSHCFSIAVKVANVSKTIKLEILFNEIENFFKECSYEEVLMEGKREELLQELVHRMYFTMHRKEGSASGIGNGTDTGAVVGRLAGGTVEYEDENKNKQTGEEEEKEMKLNINLIDKQLTSPSSKRSSLHRFGASTENDLNVSWKSGQLASALAAIQKNGTVRAEEEKTGNEEAEVDGRENARENIDELLHKLNENVNESASSSTALGDKIIANSMSNSSENNSGGAAVGEKEKEKVMKKKKSSKRTGSNVSFSTTATEGSGSADITDASPPGALLRQGTVSAATASAIESSLSFALAVVRVTNEAVATSVNGSKKKTSPAAVAAANAAEQLRALQDSQTVADLPNVTRAELNVKTKNYIQQLEEKFDQKFQEQLQEKSGKLNERRSIDWKEITQS